MIQGGENEEDDHEDQWAQSPNGTGGCDGKESHQAELGDVETDKQMLQCPRIDASFGVDVGIAYEEEVVTVGQVEQVEADCGE